MDQPISEVTEPQTRDEYFELLKVHNTNRIDYNTRKWETVKFFQSIFSALITAAIAATIIIWSEDLSGEHLLRLLVSILPFCGGLAVVLATRNLYRESRLLYMDEVQIFKLVRLLGLNVKVGADSRWIPGDEELLSAKWSDYTYGTKGLPEEPNLEDWLKARMRKHVFYKLFARLFTTEAVLAFAAAILILVAPWLPF